MRRDREIKVISALAIIIGILGISIGMASIATQLTIEPSVSVTPDKRIFNVDFSTNPNKIVSGRIEGVVTGDAIATSAIIDNSKLISSVKNLSVNFKEPGSSVTYKFYVRNEGGYRAFLNMVKFADISGRDTFKICKAKSSSADLSTIRKACDNINLTLKIGNKNNELTFNKTVQNIGATHSLMPKTSEPIEITISYTGNIEVNDDFTVNFGEIILMYENID